MHTFTPAWTELSDEPPPIVDYRFRSADDVIAYCQHEPLSVLSTYPELWHLDEDGQFVCCSKGTTLSTLEYMAEHPSWLLDCREFDADDSCPNQWVIVAPRPGWLFDGKAIGSVEIDAFIELRRWLWRNEQLHLLDYVAIDDCGHWWSLNELVCGTRIWNPPPLEACRPATGPSSTNVDEVRDSA